MFDSKIQVETASSSETKRELLKVPVAVLKAGETRSIQVHLEFPDSPVTFRLVEGNGPVYIHGQQSPGNYEIDDSTELSGGEEVSAIFDNDEFSGDSEINNNVLFWC